MMLLPPLELRPAPGPAQDWVRHELAKPEYQPTLLERLVQWGADQLGKLIEAAQSVGRLDSVVALGLLAALVVGLAVVLARLRREPRRRGPARSVLDETRTTASQYRARAGRAFTEERWDDAVLDGMRAIAVGLVERALIDDLPSATAHEVSATAAAVFPTEQARLDAAARLFDDVRYGDRRATREGASALLELERTLRSLRPDTPEGAGGAGHVLAVPR